MPETPNFENPYLWFKVYTKEFGRDKDLLVIWKYSPNNATQNSKTGQKGVIKKEFSDQPVI